MVLDCAERLTALCPASLNVAMFACTGTEANELALRMARTVTGNDGIVVVEDAYHGNSHITAQLSGRAMPGGRLDDNIVSIPSPDTYRGAFRDADAAVHYAALADDALKTLAERGHRPAAFIIDTLLSSNGLPTIPDGWLTGVVGKVRAAGGVYIADEVQAGFGRTGTHFWGFERLGVEPDLITMGKPMGNGHPVSALVTSHELTTRFREQSHYFNTFGGNAVSCAAALAVLDIIEAEQLQNNALKVGDYLRRQLAEKLRGLDFVGDIRGQGLFNAIDLVQDRASRAPAPELAHAVVNGLRESGVLIGASGPASNVLKIRTPLVLSRDDVDYFISKLCAVLNHLPEQVLPG
jgi:4-aminobutyrate aminotransferase-like enzyme